jgi:hypothetical protein
MKASNEKLIETLFIYHALRFLADDTVTVYTPSTREEAVEGYDAKLMGASEFDQLYLQFKTPNLLVREDAGRNGYSFATTPHQHRRLKRYPVWSAFYVTHTFRSVEDVQSAQMAAKPPDTFLRRYFGIEIEQLHLDISTFRYYAPTPGFLPNEIKYKLSSETTTRTPTHPLRQGHCWLDGEEILERFKNRKIGARVRLVSRTADELSVGVRHPILDLPPFDVTRDLLPQMGGEEDEGGGYGTAIRRNHAPLTS